MQAWLTGLFLFSANANDAREAHTATALPDGGILVAGGLSAVGFIFHDTAEIYDAAEERFRRVGGMSDRRAFHAALWLPAVEKVLLVGGDSGRGELAGADLFDPVSETFQPSLSILTHYSKAPTATLLDDGRVLVAAGANAVDGTLSQAWLYYPGEDDFDPTGGMNERRMAHAAARLVDGRVLVSGGWSDSQSPPSSTGSIEIFDPASETWEMLPASLFSPRHDHVMVLLDDCRLFVAGGQQVLPESSPTAPRNLEVITVP